MRLSTKGGGNRKEASTLSDVIAVEHSFGVPKLDAAERLATMRAQADSSRDRRARGATSFVRGERRLNDLQLLPVVDECDERIDQRGLAAAGRAVQD